MLRDCSPESIKTCFAGSFPTFNEWIGHWGRKMAPHSYRLWVHPDSFSTATHLKRNSLTKAKAEGKKPKYTYRRLNKGLDLLD